MTSNLSKIDSPDLQQSGIDQAAIERLYKRIEGDVSAGLYPGATVAMARKGRLIFEANFGYARLAAEGKKAQPATDNTLWLLYSQTKPVTSCAAWLLAERGQLSLHTPVAFYLPEFARHGKDQITAYHLLTHQAGFPNAMVSEPAWANHDLLKEEVCNFIPDWPAGSKVFYHSYAAHWVLAVLIEAITRQDFREYISSEILRPLGLVNFLVGVAEKDFSRLAGAYHCPDATQPTAHLHDRNFDKSEFYASGMPGAGGYGTASDVAMFYQMLLGQGTLNGRRLLSPLMVQYATRNHTGDRIDEFFGAPMHRALGVHVRGNTPALRGLGSAASPATFGHGGVGTSYSFADPLTGVSFSYITNSRLTEPGHTKRLDEIITMAQSSINIIL